MREMVYAVRDEMQTRIQNKGERGPRSKVIEAEERQFARVLKLGLTLVTV